MRYTLVRGGDGWLLTVLCPLTTVALRVCLVLAFGTPALAFFALPQLFFYCDIRTSTDNKRTSTDSDGWGILEDGYIRT